MSITLIYSDLPAKKQLTLNCKALTSSLCAGLSGLQLGSLEGCYERISYKSQCLDAQPELRANDSMFSTTRSGAAIPGQS